MLSASLFMPLFGAQKDWTWMVFINADNDLDPFGVHDQEEMAKVGSSDHLNIVTLIDRAKGPATLNFIEKGNVRKLRDLGEVDMGDYRVFVDFVKETAATFPADHYAIVIWNHGSGWEKTQGEVLKGISYDYSSGNHFTTEQIGLAGAEIKRALGRKIDLLCFDACLMQMMEVAYVLPASVDFIVGSEETEPGDGYPYDDILAGIRPGMTPRDLGRLCVEKYAGSYSGGSQGSKATTQSCLDCAKLPALMTALDAFAKVAMAGDHVDAFLDALRDVQRFFEHAHIDLPNFLALAKAASSDAGLKNAIARLEKALGDVIVANGNSGEKMKNARGLAVYFPATGYLITPEYKELAFVRGTLWDELILDYYRKLDNGIVSDVALGPIDRLAEFLRQGGGESPENFRDLSTMMRFQRLSENPRPAFPQADPLAMIPETPERIASGIEH